MQEAALRSKVLKGAVATGVVWLGAVLACTGSAAGQRAAAVPKLDLNRFTGVWYEQARLPVKSEKKCLSEDSILYSLGEKANSFQLGTFCRLKTGITDVHDAKGKAGKSGDGRLKLDRFLFFHSRYWVLAVGPAYEWALVGTPNHKNLWILSRTANMAPEMLSQLEAQAKSMGYKTSKLIAVTQRPRLEAAPGSEPHPQVGPNH